jgi:integrase
MGKLTVSGVRTLRAKGKYLDGQGLLLNVVGPDQRYWMFRYRRGGRERTMSLGNAEVIGLAEARRLHQEARGTLARGIDPLAERQVALAASRAREEARSFAAAARAYIEAHRASWRGRTEEHWSRSLATYAFPVFGAKPVGEVGREDILRCLEPIWRTKTVTATNLRNRIELVIDYSIAHEWRTTEANPARWKGGLKALLPARVKLHTTTHRPALSWKASPEFMTELLAAEGMAARCLAFCILTGTRSAEARGALWSEIDMENAVWRLPAVRMKARRPHTVPLSQPAMTILRDLYEVRTGDLVFFSSRKHGALIADCTLRDVLERLHPGITVHGFRSTFSTWAADHRMDATLVETSLAHAVGNAVSQVYQRSDLLEARRPLMDAWAAFLTRPPAEVVPLPVRAEASA